MAVRQQPPSSNLPPGWRCWREKFPCSELSVGPDAAGRAPPWVSTVKQGQKSIWKKLEDVVFCLYKPFYLQHLHKTNPLVSRLGFLKAKIQKAARNSFKTGCLKKKKTDALSKRCKKTNCLYHGRRVDRRQQNIDA